jgi:response regulator of citrate/malate metabolism
MATLNLDILNAAHEDGLIGIALSKRQILYLEPSVLTANRIIKAIELRGDATAEQLERDLILSRNTLNMYLRWIEKRGYIKSRPEPGQNGNPKLYWRI